MSAISGCDNDRCVCTPCTCEECRCGGARLGDLERKVMQVLWAGPSDRSGRQVANRLPDHAYTTVATVLDRLVKKGQVRRRREGRTLRFSATGSDALHAAQAMREALDAAGDPAGALQHFADGLDPEQARAVLGALGVRPPTRLRRS